MRLGIHWCHSLPLWLVYSPHLLICLQGECTSGREREATKTRPSPQSLQTVGWRVTKSQAVRHPQQCGDCNPPLPSALPLLSQGDRCSRTPDCTISEGNTKQISEDPVPTVAITITTLPSGPWQVCWGLCFRQLWPEEALPGWWNVPHTYGLDNL